MTTLRQIEHGIELVNDSVMTRTLEGRINSWSQSAEELYGWRKEEVIGKVSHDLLRTQFPKSLEEIESELVQNGRWEGNLVHTTRVGERVVVKSRWAVDLAGETGASVIEINTPCTLASVACMQKTMPTKLADRNHHLHVSQASLKAEHLFVKIANVGLGGAGIVCLLILLRFILDYGWNQQKYFASWVGPLLYYVCPAALAILLFVSLRLCASRKVNLVVLLYSSLGSIYLVETVLTFWSNLPSVIDVQSTKTKIEIAKELGINFDARDKQQVVDDLNSRGFDAVPLVFPKVLLNEQPDGTLKSTISINGSEVLPLAGIANKITVLCNESGEFVTYKSDQHGFNNPPHLWDMTPISIVSVGDSFVNGRCVPPDTNFTAVIRKRSPVSLNLGIDGNGPLTELATLKEYAQVVKPKVVLWFYFEGNDLADLIIESKSRLLTSYLMREFSQGLFGRQSEIDRALSDYIKMAKPKSKVMQVLEELTALIRDPQQGKIKIKDIFKLVELRQRLGLVDGRERESTEGYRSSASIEARKRAMRPATDLFYNVLLEARRSVENWGGVLYFVYLPGWQRYAPGNTGNPDRDAVLEMAAKVGLPIIDVHQAFAVQKDPVNLFPFRLDGHYTEEGNRIVADYVLQSIPVPYN